MAPTKPLNAITLLFVDTLIPLRAVGVPAAHDWNACDEFELTVQRVSSDALNA